VHASELTQKSYPLSKDYKMVKSRLHPNEVAKAVRVVKQTNTAHHCHIRALKKVQSPTLPDGFHQIDGLLDKRGKGSKTQYLVQWAGTQADGSAWPATWKPQKFIARAHERHFNLQHTVLKAIGLDPKVCLAATYAANKKKEAELLLQMN